MAIGKKTGGGSRKGIPNKATAKREAEIKASGITPLDFMLKTLRNVKLDHEERMKAAINAAPYVHPKLSTISGDPDNPLQVISHIEVRIVG